MRRGWLQWTLHQRMEINCVYFIVYALRMCRVRLSTIVYFPCFIQLACFSFHLFHSCCSFTIFIPCILSLFFFFVCMCVFCTVRCWSVVSDSSSFTLFWFPCFSHCRLVVCTKLISMRLCSCQPVYIALSFLCVRVSIEWESRNPYERLNNWSTILLASQNIFNNLVSNALVHFVFLRVFYVYYVCVCVCHRLIAIEVCIAVVLRLLIVHRFSPSHCHQ